MATTTRNPFFDDPANLLFEDNFDGTSLDGKKWSKCPEWERQGSAVWDRNMSFLDGAGHLVLRAEWDASISKVRAGAVRTLGKFSAGYAYYEASICFPQAYGTWGAFWLMCGDVSEGKGGVEVDIVESIHNERGQCQAALHWNGYGDNAKSLNSGAIKAINIYDGNFHTFGLERTDVAYIFYIDGIQVWKSTNAEVIACDDLAYMKLTIEAAAWAGAGTSTSINSLPAEMLVDYVRVYQIRPW
ncbi:MAG: glycoside hydrolase family 16 protein [Clostridia bacterium]|nr:glycoside hydrolase family 16 protein [Clostridia bacterium]MBO7150432.1 glycoside hydrolase family 16 protein [Clostridia bacterium]